MFPRHVDTGTAGGGGSISAPPIRAGDRSRCAERHAPVGKEYLRNVVADKYGAF